jgi:threonine/homoserine/homoserine lactone efflux protein
MMFDLLPPWPLLSFFLFTSFVLAITPGPGVFYILTRTLSQGRGAGLVSVLAVALGNFGNALGAALGLAALFALSSTAFLVVKYMGALYLMYLGVQALRQRDSLTPGTALPAAALRRIFRDGFIVALLNPKTAIFFAAFLPQFMPHDGAAISQSVVLGGLFVLIAFCTDSLYALAAGALAPWLRQRTELGHWGHRLTGGAFISLGLLTALSGRSR